ncbi:hypothetical protein DSBG_2702 [Desulfosporosinus sp. BG]|nr:hypothetical protein DSBG_2702 [Desulfosporosinus sp. BG]
MSSLYTIFLVIYTSVVARAGFLPEIWLGEAIAERMSLNFSVK